MLLISRTLLRDKLQDMENELRGTLRNFGLKVGVVSPGCFEARIKELVAGQPPVEMIVAPLLAVRRVSHARATRKAGQNGSRPGPRRQAVPPADDRTRCWADRGTDLPGDG